MDSLSGDLLPIVREVSSRRGYEARTPSGRFSSKEYEGKDDQGKSKTPQNLCELCRDAFKRVLDFANDESLFTGLFCSAPYGGVVDHYSRHKDLAASALQGCGLCSWLNLKFDPFRRVDPVFADFSQDHVMNLDTRLYLTFRVLEVRTASNSTRKTITQMSYGSAYARSTFELVLLRGEESAFPVREVGKLPNLEMAKSWVQSCISNHEHNPSYVKEYPTRLIDLKPQGGTETRLIITDAQIRHDLEYVALSHCWGEEPIRCKTTKSNINSYMTNIPREDFPRNFRDAIHVTQELGYRYLWIDSLCIIQDDQQDWEKECHRMQFVFGNAVITLAAMESPSANVGFLSCRDNADADMFVLNLRTKKDKQLLLGVRPIDEIDSSWSSSEINYRSHGILDIRAWAFQEALLSSRLLTFGRRQMSFRCDDFECFECCNYPRAPSDGAQRVKPLWLRNPTTKVDVQHLESTSSEMAREFHQLVSIYSHRYLSYGADKLPALAAIANRYQQVTGDTYLAGLWRKAFLPGLLWQRTTDCLSPSLTRHRIEPVNSAPSWSWAGMRYPIDYPWWIHASSRGIYGGRTKLANVVSATTQLAGTDTCGQILSAELRLRGWTVSGKLSGQSLYEGSSSNAAICFGPGDHYPFGEITFDDPFHATNIVESEVTCLVIGKDEMADEKNYFRTPPFWYGLALQRVGPRRDAAYYRRIGLCHNLGWRHIEERLQKHSPSRPIMTAKQTLKRLCVGEQREVTII